MILRCPRICPYPANVCLYCIQIWRTILVATYIRYTLCSLYMPSSAGNSKTTISTYAAVIRTLRYDWGTNVLPTYRPPRSELVLSSASILSYVDQYVHSLRAAFNDPQLRTVPLWHDSTLSTITTASTILGIHYDDSTVSFCAILQMTILTALMPFYQSADISTMLWINCELPTQWIRQFHKASCVVYRSSHTHTHANTLTVEITSNACMSHVCVYILYLSNTVT